MLRSALGAEVAARHHLAVAADGFSGVRREPISRMAHVEAGVARCAGCRLVLRRTTNPQGFVSYGCRTSGCPGRSSVGAPLLDAHVAELVNERLARLVMQPRPADDGGEGERLQAAATAAARELEAWRDDIGLRDALGEHDWREGMLARARARDDAEVALDQHRASSIGLVDVPDGRVVRLDDLPWTVQRQVVDVFIHAVWVRRSTVRGPGARQHVAPRVLVTWADERERPELPGRRGGDLPPVEW